ncbi:preprotein translocase subunit SecA [Listeria grayi]|uniref:Preprotein translocase subunit SecA n=1 Tax=Listeria grayi TaxID=1641 RepID=A0A378MHV6_LISGR|nr:preprotein translocase subunit SecA [Listeria grayi]
MGRAGRRGDLGFSKFMISLEDDLLADYDSKRWIKLREKLLRRAPRTGKPVNKLRLHTYVYEAQKRLEGANYDLRKELLSYDEVIDLQRKMVYQERNELLQRQKLGISSEKILREIAEQTFKVTGDEQTMEEAYKRQEEFLAGTSFPMSMEEIKREDPDVVIEKLINWHKGQREKIPAETMSAIEKEVYLNLMDQMWVMHLDEMVQLREGIHLRAYAQQDPLVMYQKEGGELFKNFNPSIIFISHMLCWNWNQMGW